MKKIFAVTLLVLLFTGTVMAGTTIALRGDGRIVFIDEAKEEVTGKVVTDGIAGALGTITPDGKMLYVGNSYLGQYTTSIIDLQKRALIKNLPTGPSPKAPLVSPDGKWVGVNHSNYEHGKVVVAIIDTAKNEIKHSIRLDIKNLDRKGPVSMHNIWTRDSKYFIINNYFDNTIYLIDAASGKEAVKLQLDGNPHYFDITKDNKELWVLVEGEEDDTGNIIGCPKIHVFNLADITKPGTMPEAKFCMVLNTSEASEGHHGAFTLDGKYYYMANRGPGPNFGGTSINVFDVSTKKQIAHITTGGNGDGHPYMSPDGKYVVMTQYGDNVISFIDAKEHKIVKEMPVGAGKHVGFATFTKDGKKAFITNKEDDAVYVIDMKKLEVKKKIETAEPDRKFKTQWQVLNGYYNVFETTEKYID